MDDLKEEQKNIPAAKKDAGKGTIEDIKDSVGILEKLANIFISIFSIFKSKQN